MTSLRLPQGFSIIVPTFNRPQRLAACIGALSRLDYPRDCFEIIVVNDGSDTDLAPVLAANRGQCAARLLRVEHGGPARARNRGAQEARYSRLAFTDDDCQPRPGWLLNAARHLPHAAPTALAGKVVNGLTTNPYATLSQSIIDRLFVHGNRDPAHATFATTSNLIVDTNAFHELGGFDSTFTRAAGEDRDLCDRWLSRGHPMLYADDCVVDHYHDMGFAGFCRQHFHYGRGAHAFYKARAQRAHTQVRIEPSRFYLDLLLDLLRPPLHAGGSRVTSLSLLVVSQLLHTMGFLTAAARAQSSRGGEPADS